MGVDLAQVAQLGGGRAFEELQIGQSGSGTKLKGVWTGCEGGPWVARSASSLKEPQEGYGSCWGGDDRMQSLFWKSHLAMVTVGLKGRQVFREVTGFDFPSQHCSLVPCIHPAVPGV